MTFLELTQKRNSVRGYSPRNVEPKKLEYLLECARQAPTAVNYQPWCCIVAGSDEACAKVRACYPREWFDTAPMYMIICGNHEASWKRSCDGKDHCDIDAAIVVEHIVLAAVEQGLGTCWVCNFDAKKCRELFKIPNQWEPIAILSVGYPSETVVASPSTGKRKTLSELVKWNEF